MPFYSETEASGDLKARCINDGVPFASRSVRLQGTPTFWMDFRKSGNSSLRRISALVRLRSRCVGSGETGPEFGPLRGGHGDRVAVGNLRVRSSSGGGAEPGRDRMTRFDAGRRRRNDRIPGSGISKPLDGNRDFGRTPAQRHGWTDHWGRVGCRGRRGVWVGAFPGERRHCRQKDMVAERRMHVWQLPTRSR